ncbi:MAG: 4-alpha-glucanotransferase [Steroidobacteraceae bacterium]
MTSTLPAVASPSSNPVLARRRAGVLLPVSSLNAGLGRGGRAFIDWLAGAGFTVWQILPLGPTGREGSPYWVRSDAAGNAALIDPDESAPMNSGEFQAFIEGSHDWLDDYAAFEVLSRLNHGTPWWTWSPEYRDRHPEPMERLQREQPQDLRTIREQQFTFAWQWNRLHEYAKTRGVFLFGDVPFYVAPDSAEVWANRDQFLLDASGQPTAVAGVPPDYFSELGQLWGNPLYAWEVMLKDGFRFWRSRIRHQLRPR